MVIFGFLFVWRLTAGTLVLDENVNYYERPDGGPVEIDVDFLISQIYGVTLTENSFIVS